MTAIVRRLTFTNVPAAAASRNAATSATFARAMSPPSSTRLSIR